MRVVIYARFSSDLQDPRSIADQMAACRERAVREGWNVVAELSDAAISGASMANRPGLQSLMGAAEAAAFDIVLCESLDRLSRDQEDMAAIYKRLTHRDIAITTLADGTVGKLHVGLRSVINSMFLDDLAQKTRRGLVGRLRDGRSPGGKVYGYRADINTPGVLKIVREEETIIRRIFSEYVAGRSPLAIASDLNRERIPAPRGGQWNASTINGSRKRANGVVNNRLYIGEMIFGRQRNVKDPVTGKIQKRLCPQSEWIKQAVPELAIVDETVFAAAQERRKGTCQVRLDRRRRPRRMFSGLVTCGCCGSTMAITRDDRLTCSARTNKGTCDNRRTVRAAEVEERVLALQHHLLQPDVVAAAVEAYRNERTRLVGERAKASRDSERELASIERQIERLVDAIAQTDEGRALLPRLKALEAERGAILARAPVPVPDETLALHPGAAARYRQKVANIHAALSNGDAAAHGAIALVRELITKIVVMPTPSGQMPLAVEGNLALMLDREQLQKTGAVVMVPPPWLEQGTSRSTI